jgi:hypothetical protein
MKTAKKAALSLASAIILASFATAADAQSGGFDGSPSAPVAAAQQANINVACGAQTSNLIRTESSSLTFSNTSFSTLPGSSVRVTVPSGQSRCLKVLFTAEAAATNFCYVRAVANGLPLFPNGEGFQSLVSADSTANGHAFQWVRRLSSGTYTVAIQRRVSSGRCNIDDWTVDVQLHQ